MPPTPTPTPRSDHGELADASRGGVEAGGDGGSAGRGDPPVVGAWSTGRSGAGRGRTPVRPAWIALAAAVGLEFVVGLVALLVVPVGRPSGLFPHQGRIVFAVHGVLGLLLLIGALALAAAGRRFSRMLRVASWVALAGVLVAGAGGLVAADHGLRVLGIGLMFVGSLVAGFAYLVGVLEPRPEVSEQQAGVTPD